VGWGVGFCGGGFSLLVCVGKRGVVLVLSSKSPYFERPEERGTVNVAGR